MTDNSICHFLELAKAGQDPTASKGEWVCYKIAATLHQLDDDLMLLDAEAAKGAAELIRIAAGPFSSAKGKDAIFQMIKAAGHKRSSRKKI